MKMACWAALYILMKVYKLKILIVKGTELYDVWYLKKKHQKVRPDIMGYCYIVNNVYGSDRTL